MIPLQDNLLRQKDDIHRKKLKIVKNQWVGLPPVLQAIFQNHMPCAVIVHGVAVRMMMKIIEFTCGSSQARGKANRQVRMTRKAMQASTKMVEVKDINNNSISDSISQQAQHGGSIVDKFFNLQSISGASSVDMNDICESESESALEVKKRAKNIQSYKRGLIVMSQKKAVRAMGAMGVRQVMRAIFNRIENLAQ